MKHIDINFHTNLDWYQGITWPDYSGTGIVPRIGETVYVADSSMDFCDNNNIPKRLKVVNVSYNSGHVMVELWYLELDVEKYKIGNKLNHLYKQ